MRRQAENNVNWQQRALAFKVGDIVGPFGLFDAQSGRVTAVWPAIGMIDVEMATGNKRYPVEDLQRFDSEGDSDPPRTDSAPGGQPTVQVPGGPIDKSAHRVAHAYRKAIYWADKDRQYRANRGEITSGHPACPRCEESPNLQGAIYKRRDGSSERLLGCPGCMFLIKRSDIMNLGGE